MEHRVNNIFFYYYLLKRLNFHRVEHEPIKDRILLYFELRCVDILTGIVRVTNMTAVGVNSYQALTNDATTSG